MSIVPDRAEETCIKTSKDGCENVSSIKTLSPNDAPVDECYEYPEGGLRAWLVVFGAWCSLFMLFGLVNSTAVFQTYLSDNQLKDYQPNQTAWIFSLNLFFVFFLGIYVGPMFDRYGPRPFIAIGSIALVLSALLLSFCTEYWHFMLDYAALGGLGGALLNIPSYASISHFFERRRALAVGISCTSGGLGGIMIPFMLERLLPSIGFAWSTRVLALILLVLAIPSNLFIQRRLPRSEAPLSLIPDMTVFKSLSLLLCTIGMFLMEWGLFVPIAYISSFAIANGHTTSFAFTAVALLNVGSFFGRWIPGLVADYLGRFNVILLTISLCALTTFTLWLLAGTSDSLLVAYVVVFGFASGSNLSLVPVCISQLCPIENYGRYCSAAFFIASFGTLTSIPIGGQLIVLDGGSYNTLIIFSGSSYTGALLCYTAARVLVVGCKLNLKF